MSAGNHLSPKTSAELADLDSSQNGRKIFIGGLAWSTTEDGLQEYFKRMGAPVDRLSIMRDKTTGCSRGFGFVTFCAAEGLELVCSRRHVLDGRKIECKRAIPKSEIATQMRRVFVGGIPLTLQESELRSYFESFGPIEECRIMTDRASNRSRGFAFVCFYDDEAMNSALNAKHQFDGKPFEVKKARVKQQMTFEAEAKAAAAQLENQTLLSTPSLIPTQVQLPAATPLLGQNTNPTPSPPLPQNGVSMYFPYNCFPTDMNSSFPGFYVYPTELESSALENGFYFPPGSFVSQSETEIPLQPGMSPYPMENSLADSPSAELDLSPIQQALDGITPNLRTSNRKTWTANPSKRTVGRLNRSLTASEVEPLFVPPEPNPSSPHLQRNTAPGSPSTTRPNTPVPPPSTSLMSSLGRESLLTQLHWPSEGFVPLSPKLNDARRVAALDSTTPDAFSAVKPYLYPPIPAQDQQTYLERGLSLLRPNPQDPERPQINNRRSDSPIKREKFVQAEKSRKRGASIPHNLEKNRALEQTWRQLGLPKGPEIDKYFPPIMVKGQADFS